MNAEFIEGLRGRIARVEATARAEFGGLDAAGLNVQPGAGRWSVGQCLDHLLKSNGPYFEIFEGVRDGTHRRTLWERAPLLPGLWGGIVLHSVEPDTKRKLHAPNVSTPATDPVSPDIVEVFCEQQRALAAAMESLSDTDLDAQIITSPMARYVTYSVRYAFKILVAHEERHLIQARNVLASLDAADS